MLVKKIPQVKIKNFTKKNFHFFCLLKKEQLQRQEADHGKTKSSGR